MRVFPAPGVAWQKKCGVTVKCSNALVMLRISVNVTAHFANNVTGGFTRLRGV